VWLIIEEGVTAQDVAREAGKWLSQKDTFGGFITDLRGMRSIPSLDEQREMEEWRKQNKSGKPHALLDRTSALGALIQIYVRLTKAADTRYFMDSEAAIAWVKSFQRQG
jgi:hypothetical protein